ncbi:MAG: protein TonB [Lysobacterales bacterium]|jgi:protein TonB
MSATITQTLADGSSSQLPRIVFGAILGLVITLFLFWFMQAMIEMGAGPLDENARGSLVDFVRVKRDETPDRAKRKPEKPPPPDAPPEQPPTPQLDNLDPTADKIAISAVPVTTDIEMTGGFSLGVGEGDYLPIVKVAPIYPQRALTRGIEGYCVVEYTVTRQGTTREPVVVEDQCTSSLFHRASLQAALKFKYKPRILDGEATEVRGVQNKFTYEITE